jgi:hypothetical protein
MGHRRQLRTPFVVTLGATAIVSACGSGVTAGGVNPPPPDGGNPAGCPASSPVGGTTCPLADGTECKYGDVCSPTIFECVSGQWQYANGNPPAPTCPGSQPADGSSCACLPANFSCSYPDARCSVTKFAVCSGGPDGTWSVSDTTCNPPGPDAGFDAANDASTDSAAADATKD